LVLNLGDLLAEIEEGDDLARVGLDDGRGMGLCGGMTGLEGGDARRKRRGGCVIIGGTPGDV
jgi:hypothetical protein